MIRRPPRSTLFPYPPLSRSHVQLVANPACLARVEHLSVGVALRGVVRRQRFDVHAAHGLGLDLVARRDRVDPPGKPLRDRDRKSTRLNSSHANISYAVFCLK